jgi:hypothetical protein
VPPGPDIVLVPAAADMPSAVDVDVDAASRRLRIVAIRACTPTLVDKRCICRDRPVPHPRVKEATGLSAVTTVRSQYPDSSE